MSALIRTGTGMKRWALALGLAVACLAAGNSPAAVVIAGTRVVFPAERGEVTVRLSNEGEMPALVEAWIDNGDPNSTPDQSHVPFLITPPLFRMNAGKGQSLRIVYSQEPLPADRESVFWLNVLEIPPKPAAGAEPQHTLQFAVRSRLKLFYRPPNLAGEAAKAPAAVTWKGVADNGNPALEVHNPSPYYITFSKLALAGGAAPLPVEGGMVAPFGSLRLAVKNLPAAPAPGTTLEYTTINDYGASVTWQGTVSP
jgi:chaperone protein EcpD